MKAELIAAEIGSTITKVSAFSGLDSKKPLFIDQQIALTSIKEGDVSVGFERALEKLKNRGVDISGSEIAASASAAGGLRMSVHGLTRDMTLRAAREATLGAGANISYLTAGIISEDERSEIISAAPNLILIAGGVDFGDKRTVIENAKIISEIPINIPVIYSGNKSAALSVKRIFEHAGKDLWIVENVYPKIDELNIKPVREIIHKVFAAHIASAPGIDRIKKVLSSDIVPTPGAVLTASELLYGEIGDLVTVDIGGATSDVHSVTDGNPVNRKLMIAPEPLSKRTVEGDLGVFHNAANIIQAGGGERTGSDKIIPLPESSKEKQQVKALTRIAVDTAVYRHCGEIKTAYGAYGKNEVLEGKDLSAVISIIGTGGALTRLESGAEILSKIRRVPGRHILLPPENSNIYIDRNYIMASCGVISRKYPAAALSLLLNSIGIKGGGS